MAESNDEMPPWLTPVDESEGSLDIGIFSGNMKKIVIGVAVIVVAVFSVAMWMMYDRPADNFEQPIEIAAAMGPIRERPEEQGGKNIPDQDKEVFKRLTGEGDDKTEITLGEEAETPLSELPADPIKEEIKKIEELAENKVETASVPEKKTTLRSRIKPAVPKQEKPKTVIPKGKHQVQLGAYSTQLSAEKFWQELRTKMPSDFKAMKEEYVPLTRNGRTLYRLRAGPIDGRAAADRLCMQLKTKQQACMVVDPK